VERKDDRGVGAQSRLQDRHVPFRRRLPDARSPDASRVTSSEYFEGIDDELPAALRLGREDRRSGRHSSRARPAAAARKNIESLAQRFIAGATPERRWR
jgi:hypothetical protein